MGMKIGWDIICLDYSLEKIFFDFLLVLICGLLLCFSLNLGENLLFLKYDGFF